MNESAIEQTGRQEPSEQRVTERFATPRTNIYETKDAYVLEVEMPGVAKGDTDVTVQNHTLIISGTRSPAADEESLLYRESLPLNYRRAFELEATIDADKINARLEQGVLTLNLPKAEAVKPRKVQIS